MPSDITARPRALPTRRRTSWPKLISVTADAGLKPRGMPLLGSLTGCRRSRDMGGNATPAHSASNRQPPLALPPSWQRLQKLLVDQDTRCLRAWSNMISAVRIKSQEVHGLITEVEELARIAPVRRVFSEV